VVTLIRRSWHPFRPAVDGQDNVGFQLPEGARDLLAQFGAVADIAVRKVPEIQVAYPDDRRGSPLLCFTDRSGFLGGIPAIPASPRQAKT